MSDWITIDGAQGEGGGQILRTALSLSLATGRPLRIERIRAGRAKPGLLRQHLTAVRAAADVGRARVTGADLGATALEFAPSAVRGGDFHLAVGTAGSATLVLQAVLPALLLAREPSRLTLEGGTHNPFAPPFDFLQATFLPVLRRMGAGVDARLDAHGFYPAGGGRFTVTVEPASRLRPVSLLARSDARVSVRALVSSLPASIGKREIAIVRERLGLEREACRVESVDGSIGPGNVLLIAVAAPEVTEVITGFGVKGVSAEDVASAACDEAAPYLAAGVPVGVYLADQLLLPLALGAGGAFRTLAPSAHTRTNADVIRRFLDVPIAFADEGGGVHRVTVGTHPAVGERHEGA